MSWYLARHFVSLALAFWLSVVLVPRTATKPKLPRSRVIDAAMVETLVDRLGLRQKTTDRIRSAADAAARGDSYMESLVRTFDERMAERHDGRPDTVPLLYTIHNTSAAPCANPVFGFEDTKGFIFRASAPWKDWYLGAVALENFVHWESHGFGWGTNHLEERDMMREMQLKVQAVDRLTNGRFLTEVRLAVAKAKSNDAVSVLPPKESFDDLMQASWMDEPAGPEERCAREIDTMTAFILETTDDPELRIVSMANGVTWIITERFKSTP